MCLSFNRILLRLNQFNEILFTLKNCIYDKFVISLKNTAFNSYEKNAQNV